MASAISHQPSAISHQPSGHRHGEAGVNRQRGYTLIEMSIVLVIIGLIVGGIVVGQGMIETAKARGTLTEFEKFEAAANTFKVKYGHLPGDIPNPQRFAFSSLNNVGNGNGAVESYWDQSYQSGETILFWRHLQQAKLIATSIDEALTDGCATNLPPPYIDINHFKKYHPLSSALNNGAQWLAFPGYSKSVATWGLGPPAPGGSLDGSNYLMLAFIYRINDCGMQLNSAYTGSYHPSIPYYMDTKRDDGLPNSGKITIVDNTGAFGRIFGGPNFASSTACLTSATSYNLTGNYNPLVGSNWDWGGCTTRIKVNY